MLEESVYTDLENPGRLAYVSFRGMYGLKNETVNIRQLNVSRYRPIGRESHMHIDKFLSRIKHNRWQKVAHKDLFCTKCEECTPRFTQINGYIEPANGLLCWSCVKEQEDA